MSAMDETVPRFPLLLDEPTDVDLLSFDAVAGTVVEALLDKQLDPIALGLSGSWGTGKTSVLRLIAGQLRSANDGSGQRLVIETDPWRYDPQLGAKESLIGEILIALEAEIPEGDTGDKARKLVARLLRRVDWAKGLQVAAKSAITLTLPSVEAIEELIKPKDEANEPEPITDMVRFRAQFENLLGSEGLNHLENVVILVDDLDRCLPETVVQTLETIRLFLSVPKMSFVIAADEKRIAEAIAAHFPPTPAAAGEETPAQLYLHKIVQTSVPVPALSDFDAEAYLVLLQIRPHFEAEDFLALVKAVADARRTGSPLDSVAAITDDRFVEARNTAARLKPIVHEKTKGNPRRIKRFLNDLSVRLGIAARRGINLDAATIAKLMVLEQYFPEHFNTVTDWLRQNTLRANLVDLEKVAGTPDAEIVVDGSAATSEPDAASVDQETAPVKPSDASDKITKSPKQTTKDASTFADELIRWARLSPPLSNKDIASYLVFAASFKGVFFGAQGLPERLRDLATSLLSASVTDNRSVTSEMLQSLPLADAKLLIAHLGAVVVDQPERQTPGATGLIRMARHRNDVTDEVVSAFKRLPASELKPGAVLQMESSDPQPLLDQIDAMVQANGSTELAGALSVVRGEV